MAKSDLTIVTKDEGNVEFVPDLERGLLTVKARAPLGVQPVEVSIGLLDFLDAAAKVTLAANQVHRDVLAHMRARRFQ